MVKEKQSLGKELDVLLEEMEPIRVGKYNRFADKLGAFLEHVTSLMEELTGKNRFDIK